MIRVVLLALALMFALAPPLRAADDVATAQDIIRAQEQALGRDDFAAAYGYAAPAIQALFAVDAFTAMVQKSYAPVYRHKRFEFGASAAADGKIVQRVHIVDADNVSWEAVYTIEPQPDGAMKISGCVLVKADQAV